MIQCSFSLAVHSLGYLLYINEFTETLSHPLKNKAEPRTVLSLVHIYLSFSLEKKEAKVLNGKKAERGKKQQ